MHLFTKAVCLIKTVDTLKGLNGFYLDNVFQDSNWSLSLLSAFKLLYYHSGIHIHYVTVH